MNEKGLTQDASLRFLKEFVNEVCKQDKDEQQNYFKTLYLDIINDLSENKSNSNDFMKGIFTFTIQLFSHLNKEVYKDSFVSLV